ncbi:glycosyltransferase family 2 protein [Shimia haliotis]|uniref:Glycosyl transferase family 2 n=1 Tax=Shimia haliotis TaxID=1280847 RepID=A0A1I4DSG0_9RHOB|nr:glycosyltransferase family 2 protein [Shimia haliotis]SFK94986.1 Glycosyl transferase family 2 [Shimia haliotis]
MAFFGFGSDSAAPKVTVVTTMKDEGAYILDWVAHYKALGATDIVVFTNDCSDQTDLILRNLNRMGEVHHRFNRVMKRGPHKSALMWAQHEPCVRDADYILVVDVDEFLQIGVGDGTFKALIERHPDADAISLVWRIFGNAGIEEISDMPVPQQFTKAEPEVPPADKRPHRFFKTLFRNNEKFNRMGVHRPFVEPEAADINWVTPDGTRLDDRQVRGALHIDKGFGYDVAQLNHYALRSQDSFLNKQRRGRANHVNGKLQLPYWAKFDQNQTEDTRLATHFDAALEVKAELLKDEALKKHHLAAIDWAQRMAQKARRQRPTKMFLAKLEARGNVDAVNDSAPDTEALRKSG